MAVETELAIGGMTCAACQLRVERVLAAVPGVTEARVDLLSHRARVTHQGVLVPSLLSAVHRAGYVAVVADDAAPQRDHERRELLRRLVVGTVLGLPVIVVAMSHGMMHVPYGTWWQAALSAPVMAYSGWPMFRSAAVAAWHRSVNMNSMVALGVGAALAVSVHALVKGHHEVYFEAAVAPILFVLLSRWIEATIAVRAAEAMRKLQPRVGTMVWRVRDGARELVRAEELAPGDHVEVRPGEALAVDGVVISGSSYIDESMLTGETLPQSVAAGRQVSAGTINGAGTLVVEARSRAQESLLATIVREAQRGQLERGQLASVADRVAAIMVPVVMVLAAVTLVGWGLVASWSQGVAFATAVLMVACPCALGLATPAVYAGAFRELAARGIVAKSGRALERAAEVTTVVFDKTGTLTAGRADVVEVVVAGAPSGAQAAGSFGTEISGEFWPAGHASPAAPDDAVLPAVPGGAGFDHDTVVRVAAALEQRSEHPVAGAILRYAGAHGLVTPEAHDVEVIAGGGLAGKVEGRHALVGTRALLLGRGISDVPDDRHAHGTVAHVAIDGRWRGTLVVQDVLRPDARAGIALLHADGLATVMLTGDHPNVAHAVAASLDISKVLAHVSPHDKAAHLEALAAKGPVAMVGDGLNDAIALSRAQVSMAMGGGTDVSLHATDIILQAERVVDVALVLRLARWATRRVKQNLTWAFAYNFIALPIAAGALYPSLGWRLSPMLASALMAASSISVLLNSQRGHAKTVMMVPGAHVANPQS